MNNEDETALERAVERAVERAILNALMRIYDCKTVEELIEKMRGR